MPDVSGGELQTLISTLQSTNTQLGHVVRAIQGASPLPPTAPVSAFGAVSQRTGPPPAAPDGYVTVEIPGVGPRLVPYYPV